MKLLKKYFDFSQGELYGILFLTVLIIATFVIVSFDYQQITPDDFSKQEAEIEAFLDKIEQEKLAYENSNHSKYEEKNFQNKKNILKPFFFDPNKLTKAEWEKLGLSEKQASIILNFIGKGGKLRNKEDFSKIYSISKEDYEILAPYIQIQVDNKKQTFARKSTPVFSIEFNSANEEDFINIPGVGPSFAKRIMKYKERLGGYTDSTQLLEIFGMDTAKYRQILPYFSFNSDSIRKKNVNTESFKELIKHPYFTKSTAYLLMQYKQIHGEIKSQKDIRSALKNNDSIYRKISPYIKTSGK